MRVVVACGIVGAETSLGGHSTSYGVMHHGNHLFIVGGGGPGVGLHRNWYWDSMGM